MAALALMLVGCGESAEEAYERGVEEGAEEVCWKVKNISDGVYSDLRRSGHC